jgi:hypothetical protein
MLNCHGEGVWCDLARPIEYRRIGLDRRFITYVTHPDRPIQSIRHGLGHTQQQLARPNRRQIRILRFRALLQQDSNPHHTSQIRPRIFNATKGYTALNPVHSTLIWRPQTHLPPMTHTPQRKREWAATAPLPPIASSPSDNNPMTLTQVSAEFTLDNRETQHTAQRRRRGRRA